MDKISDYESAVRYMRSLEKRGSVLGLERIKTLCDKLCDVQNKVPAIHVAGTNGKGSTCAMLSSILTAAGYRVGMYTSPSLTNELDHYRICGELIGKEDYTDYVNQIASAMNEYDIAATQFEAETALAFLAFAWSKCDIEIIECGLGGRDDATNIIDNPLLCVLTSISLDHAAILGDTVEKIAEVKSGIIRKNSRVVTFTYGNDVDKVIRNKAHEYDARLYEVKTSDIILNSDGSISFDGTENVRPALEGDFQKENAALVIKCVEALRDAGLNVSDEALRKGLIGTSWPYRFEKINSNPVIILDGAHNPDAARKLASTLHSKYAGYKKIMVAAVLADKDYDEIMRTVCTMADYTIATMTKNNARALDAQDLGNTISKYCPKTVVFKDNDKAALKALELSSEYTQHRENHIILCFGSLSYLASMKAEFASMMENKRAL